LGDAAGTVFVSGAPQIPLGDAAGDALRLYNIPRKCEVTPVGSLL
jgi:hypothetical protein